MSAPAVAGGQDSLPAHRHGGPVLFVVQAAGDKAVPRSDSRGSATGAFVVDRANGQLNYDITFHGLASAPRSITVRNSGKGRNGALWLTICDSTTPCPRRPSANLVGSRTAAQVRLEPEMLSELASGRMYLEVAGARGSGEIRGQLEANGAMVRVDNYFAHLASTVGDTAAVGTAVMSEIHFSNGRTSVFYQVTVANATGPVRSAALVGIAEQADPNIQKILVSSPSRSVTTLPARVLGGGGTLTGQLTLRRNQQDARFASKMLRSGTREVGILVNTAANPRGELYGVLRPIR